MTHNRASEAQLCVLTSPDLVERILALLPASTLWLGCKYGIGKDRARRRRGGLSRVGPAGRWAAAHVNRAFRQAALRLPWVADLFAYSSRPNASADTLARICGTRNLQVVKLRLWYSYHAYSALLCHARRVRALEVSFQPESTLLGWLRHTQGAGSCQGMSVLACLSSLSHLVSLEVRGGWGAGWSSVSWLSAITQLKSLTLGNYAGPPVRVLPRLENLKINRAWPAIHGVEQQAELALEQWAEPSLTALTLRNCQLRIGAPVDGSPVQACAAWLSQLRRLSLDYCFVSVHNPGLQGMVPGLTYLSFCESHGTSALSALLPRGLPCNLRELHLSTYGAPVVVLQSAISVLTDLVHLDVKSFGEAYSNEGEVAAAFKELTSLPHLKQAEWTVWAQYEKPIKHTWDAA